MKDWIKGPLATIYPRPTVTAQAHTALERHEVTRHAADLIQEAGGLLTDVRQFSNVAWMLHSEMPAHAVAGLAAALDAVGIHVDEPSRVAMAACGRHDANVIVELLLHLRFYHAEPDLRIPTPAVPG